MSTPHNSAAKGSIAKTVLMPGDPLRAKFIAEKFLNDVKQFNEVRGMLGFTGKYKGREVSVMGSGMGMPSIGIYSYELYNFYDVENIIRIGSCGAYMEELKLYDLIIAMGASTNSNFAHQFNLPGTISAIASFDLLKKAVDAAEGKNLRYHVGNILSSDVFYNDTPDVFKKWADMGIMAVEMEAYALYLNAVKAKKNALCILTVSDNLVTKEETSAAERQKSFTDMMEVALDII